MDLFTDVLIVGTGIAGLFTALNIRDDIKITLITKTKIYDSNTYLAQGGIATALGQEDVECFVEDTLKAGQYKNNISAVKTLARESLLNIDLLYKYGVNFDMNGDKFSYTREGAHSKNRIVHCKDSTGKEVADKLIQRIYEKNNINIYEDTCLVDLIADNNICCGGIVVKNAKTLRIFSKYVVLATGGIGGIFKNSTNNRNITADGISIAYKNKIKLKDLSYIQFHPTALFDPDNTHERRFLISESLRGEGGKLYNHRGERFVNELLPRDAVTAAIKKELKSYSKDFVYLDISFMPEIYIKSRFPNIYNECLKRGIDITKEPIPVAPAQHYFMGGIDVDLYSRTSMKNLFAVGEVSCTGVHGANRLASNSLLEGLVFSRRAAEVINNKIDSIKINTLKRFNMDINYESIIDTNIKAGVNLFKNEMRGLEDELVDC